MNKAQFNDCKDAGDIASQQKLKDEDLSKDYYSSAELKYTLNNPDGGCPERMFRALATAQELGIIGSDTRWDEGLTKKEAIQLYIDTLQAYTTENGYPINAIGGQGLDEVTVVEPTTTVTTDDNLGLDGEFADGEYNELDEKETDKTVDETANTNETDNDVTAEIAADLGIKTVVIDGEVYIDLGGDDDDNSGYTPPSGDTTPLPPELGPNGSGNDEEYTYGSNPNAPQGIFVQ